MIKIYVKDLGSLSPREATALGMMFMNLAGHSLQEAPPEPKVAPLVSGVPDMVLPFKNPPEPNVNESTMCPFTAPLIPPPPLSPAPMIEDNLIEEELTPLGSETVSIDEFDSDGIRWDERIHAKNKSRTTSGVWKLGRNLPPHLIKNVMKELKDEALARKVCPVPNTPPLPVAPVTIAPPPLPTFPTPPPLPVAPAPIAPAPIAPAPVAPAPVAPPPPAPVIPTAATEDAFDVLMERVMKEVQAQRLTIPVVTNIVRSFKDASGEPIVNTLGLVGTRPELIPLIMVELDKVIK